MQLWPRLIFAEIFNYILAVQPETYNDKIP